MKLESAACLQSRRDFEDVATGLQSVAAPRLATSNAETAFVKNPG